MNKMNFVKVGYLLAYISNIIPELNLRKLLKLLYFIDESSVKERGIPVTWLDYYVWQYGPVAKDVYFIKNDGGVFSQYISVHRNTAGKCIISPKKSKEESLLRFNLFEQNIIDRVLRISGCKTAEELSEETHQNNTLWKKAVEIHNIDFEISNGKTDFLLNLEDLIIDDKDKLEDYREAKEIAMI